MPETSAAKQLLDKIKAGKLAESDGVLLDAFTPRQIAVKHWAGLGTPDAVRKPPICWPTMAGWSARLRKDPAQTDATQIAAMALGSVAPNATTARTFAKGTFGTLDVTECVTTLKKRVDTTHGGDLKYAETTLTAQAATLDAIFNAERYMRLALKAQGKCRATREALTAIKNPPVIFARQANIAHEPQQVSNDSFTNSSVPTRVREKRKPRQTSY